MSKTMKYCIYVYIYQQNIRKTSLLPAILLVSPTIMTYQLQLNDIDTL